MLRPKKNSKKEFDNEKNTCDSKRDVTFLMVRPLGLFGGASAKRETRNRTQLRHVCIFNSIFERTEEGFT